MHESYCRCGHTRAKHGLRPSLADADADTSAHLFPGVHCAAGSRLPCALFRAESATQFPGPPAYDNINTLHRRSDVATGIGPKIGTTFGLPPEIRQIRGKPHPEDVPPAHDALRQIAYLKGIPAPDAYENNTNPMQKHRNRVKMVPICDDCKSRLPSKARQKSKRRLIRRPRLLSEQRALLVNSTPPNVHKL